MSLPAAELRQLREFALLELGNVLRDNAFDLSSPLTPVTLSNNALLSALGKTFRRLVTILPDDFVLVKDAMNEQNSLDAFTLSDREGHLLALLNACEQYLKLPEDESRWHTFVKAVHDRHPPKCWSPQRVSQNSNDVPTSTPIMQNSRSHMQTSTTRRTVDPLLKRELVGHLWKTEDDTFFDRFFPRLDQDMNEIPTFPSPPTQAAVLEWWKKLSDLDQNSESTWVWRSACSSPLDHPEEETKRQPDLFLYQRNQAAGNSLTAPEKEDWRWTAVVGELKLRKRATESRSDFILQLASYAREVFASQPGRGFVHSFIIVNHKMRCWVCGWSPLSSRC
jgi:hypothetical protein